MLLLLLHCCGCWKVELYAFENEEEDEEDEDLDDGEILLLLPLT